MLLSVIADAAGERLTDKLKEVLMICKKTLADPEMEVCHYTIVTMTHLVKITGSDEVTLFQQMIPAVLNKIEALAAADQDKAVTAIDIFDELIESEVTIVVPHIKPMVELCIRLSQNTGLDDSLRVKSITFLGRLTKLKKKTIVKHKLYIPMIQVIFSVISAQDLPEEDEDDEDADDENSPFLASTQSLDILALNLPPEKYITALLTQVQPALASPDPRHQRAAYQALAVSAEGCMESIRTKYLNNFLQILATGIKHDQPAVRNAALYMLGQFSEYIQPEISNHATHILPVLLDYLDRALNNLAPQAKAPASVSRIFYALETFCENLELKLIPHLELIMSRAVRALSDQFCVRVQELSISLIAAVATAVKGAIVNYLEAVMPRLEQYLTMQHTDETQVLLTQSMTTLGTLAKSTGQQHFSKEFAEKCVQIGLELVKNNDDPDVRKCAYILFGSVASVVKADMGTQLVGFLVDLMLKTIQNTEGLSYELEDNDTNIPLEDLSDEEDIESGDEKDEMDDMEGVKGVSIQNSYVEEKECAIVALKDLSVECGESFYPCLPSCYEEIWNLLDYPDADVKCAAIEAIGHFLIAYHKSGSGEGAAKFSDGVVSFLDQLVTIVKEEEEIQIVTASLDIISEMLKQCKQAMTVNTSNIDKILTCVTSIMKGDCACQDVQEEGGDEEEAEQDEMLFEYAGEIIPNLGKALTPPVFMNYFSNLLPMLLKKTKKNASISEKSFSVGAIAESIEPLSGAGVLSPVLPHILPMFDTMLRDEEDDCRNNAVYGLGELLLWGGVEVSTQRESILIKLSNMIKAEKGPRVRDNIVGAIARAVIGDIVTAPVDDIVNAVLANLPLKEDTDEYDIIFKFFTTLLTAQHPSFSKCLAKIVECAAIFYSDPSIEKEKSAPIISALLKQTAAAFGPDLQSLMSSLSSDQSQMLLAAIN